MHTLRSAAPSGALNELVRAYAQRTTDFLDEEREQRVPASLEQIIEFEFGTAPTVDYRDGTSELAHRISLVGAHTFPCASLRLPGGVESFAIFLQPIAVRLLFGLPPLHLADRSFFATDVLGPGLEHLWSRLAGASGFEERVGLAELFLLGRLPQVAERTTIARVAMVAFRGQGRIRVDQMARGVALSTRQFERQFERELGMPPKLFARIARFQGALDAKLVAPGRTWLDIAHGTGYFDQMHLIRDFRRLSGMGPSGLLAQLGDTRPPALAAQD